VQKTNIAPLSNTNWGYLLPNKTDQYNNWDDLVAQSVLGQAVQVLYTWDFLNQQTKSVNISPAYKPIGSNLPDLRPLMYLRITPRATYSGTYIWE
jgi:hypothetical protein